MDTAREEGRFRALDGMRGWAAAVVIIYHAILQYDPALHITVGDPPAQLLGWSAILSKAALTLFNGQLAVMLFFIISGFVLQRSLQNRPRLDLREALRFCLRRFFRLMPSIFVSVTAIYLLRLFYLSTRGDPPPGVMDYVKNLFLIDVRLHGVTWTIQIEMLAVPIILAVALVTRRLGFVGAGLGALYGLLATQNHELIFNYPALAVAVLPFTLGMLVAEPGFRKLFETAGTTAAILCLALFIFMRFFVYQAQIMASIAQLGAGTLLVGILAYSRANALSNAMETRLSQFLGHISYSLYLNGALVGSAFVFTLAPFWNIPASLAVPLGIPVGIAILLLTIPVAAFTERYVEQPGIELGRRLMRGRTPTRPAAASPKAAAAE